MQRNLLKLGSDDMNVHVNARNRLFFAASIMRKTTFAVASYFFPVLALLILTTALLWAAVPAPKTALPPADPVIWMTPPAAAPQIRPPFLVGIRPKTPLLWTVPVTGARPLAFTAHSLPPGLALNPRTGTLSGVLTRPGSYPVRIQVRNTRGEDTRTVRIVAGNSLALTPPMGWNSYDGFGDDVTQAEVLSNARYLAEHLQPVGWDTVVVDFRWYDPGTHSDPNHPWDRAGVPLTMDAYGRLLPSPDKFPSAAGGLGFRPLANQIHALGLKFGIHIMRGIPRNAVKANLPIEASGFTASTAADTTSTCPWCPDMYGVRGATPAGQAYYDSLLRLYASWGVDFIKVDDMSRPYHTDEIEAVRKSIDKCGRSLVLSLSPGATPLADAAHVEDHANMWRVADDFWDSWTALNNEFALGASWQSAVGPSHWPDADMLPLGHLSVSGRSVRQDRRTLFTKPEQMTLVSLWALLPAPLMVGANLPDNDPWTLALLSNPEVIALDQDALGAPARRVSVQGDTEVWTRPLADGSLAVSLFNRGDAAQPVTAHWSDLHLTGPRTARDLWQRRSLGTFTGDFTAPVPRHGVVLIRLSIPTPLQITRKLSY
jgi:alpha-galactosidase